MDDCYVYLVWNDWAWQGKGTVTALTSLRAVL